MLIELIKNWHWQHPLWLLWIPLLISLAVIYRKTQVHKGLWEKHIDKHLLDYLASNHHTKQNSRINQRFISSMAWIALIFCAIALAAPAWEKVEQPPITQQKRTIVILDMTLSMLVQDIKPSRAVRAKFKIRELLKSIPDGELALITFSGDAHIVSPFTEDFRAIDNLLAALSPDILPSIGSNPETAFALVNQMLEAQPKGYNSVVLLTDEILPSSVTNITQQLSPFINQLIVMGVGSSAGGLIPLSSGRFLKDDQGQIVSTQLDSRQLASFARQAGGSYLTLTNDNRDIKQITALINRTAQAKQNSTADLQVNQPPTQQSTQKTKMDQWENKGGWFALLIIPFFLFQFRKGYLCALLVILPSLSTTSPNAQAQTQPTDSTSRMSLDNFFLNQNQRAQQVFNTGDFKQAEQLFSDIEWKSYSQAKQKSYQQSIETLEQVLQTPELTLNKKAELLYNKAYNQAYTGDLKTASQTFAEAIKLKDNFTNAIKAKSIVDQLLEQQNQQQQQDQSGEGNGDQQDQNQNQDNNQNNTQDQGASNTDQDQQHNEQQGAQPSDQKPNEQDLQELAQRDQAQQDQAEQNKDQTPQNQQQTNDQQASEQAQQAVSDPLKENAENNNDSSPDKKINPRQLSSYEQLSEEEKAELDRWLNQLQDDPAGLLRRKFQYERRLREQEGKVIIDNENKQLW